MEQNLVNKKLDFIIGHLEQLAPYKNSSIDEIKKDQKTLKFIEKIIQEIVDAAVDTNEFILEAQKKEKPWSSKQSFYNVQDLLKEKNLAFNDEEFKLLIDSVSFRNEIVHSYDVNVYIIWSKRSLNILVEIYKKYIEKVMEFIK